VPNLLLQQRGRDTMSVEQLNRSGRVRAGIDWASTDHAVAVVDDDGVQIDRFTAEHRAGDLRRLTTRLRRTGVSEVAIERPDGPVVDALLEAGLTVFVIAPNQVKNLRSRYGSAGKVKIVAFRWAVDKQLGDAVIDFAGDSHHANPWAADLYAKARARGHDHPHAVRILARAWLHIIWRCWQDNAPYDPAKHHALQRVLNQAA
jgi:hypothetical protein